jgi:hypothetical protein
MDKLENKQGSFIQQFQYFILDSRSGGNQCFSGPNWFLPDLSVRSTCLGISVKDVQLSMQSVPIITNVVSLNPAHGEVYLIHYVIKFVSDLQLSLVSSTNKTDILLKVVLNTITLNPNPIQSWTSLLFES